MWINGIGQLFISSKVNNSGQSQTSFPMVTVLPCEGYALQVAVLQKLYSQAGAN